MRGLSIFLNKVPSNGENFFKKQIEIGSRINDICTTFMRNFAAYKIDLRPVDKALKKEGLGSQDMVKQAARTLAIFFNFLQDNPQYQHTEEIQELANLLKIEKSEYEESSYSINIMKNPNVSFATVWLKWHTKKPSEIEICMDDPRFPAGIIDLKFIVTRNEDKINLKFKKSTVYPDSRV